jgi:hypothetical protein
MRLHPGIRIHRIPLSGAAGFFVATSFAVLVLVAVPALRPLAAATVGGGVLLGLARLAVKR